MSPSPLLDAANAVAALGGCQADIDLLDDASLQAGLRLLQQLDRAAQPFRMWLATTVARRSDHTLGYEGLARRNGFPTPAAFIQSMTGSSLDEADKLARLGQMVIEAETAPEIARDGTGGSGAGAITVAAASGGISLECAEAIRRGLGTPDAAVTHAQLRSEAEKLIAHAQHATALGSVTPEALLKLARQARASLDYAAIERGEKQRSASRYLRRWQRDGMSGGSWAIPDEDGGIEINTALALLLASRTGGPRFPGTDAHGDPIAKTASELALDDERTPEQVLADGFVTIFHNGLTADPTVVPGAGRAPVRVMITETSLSRHVDAQVDAGGSVGAGAGTSTGVATVTGAGAGAGVATATSAGAETALATATALTAAAPGPAGSALLEETLSPITFAKLGEYLCEGGTVGVILGQNGAVIDVGREQRLFTKPQRTALGLRDGGCRFPGCRKPVSWTEAHHIDYWIRDRGRTDTDNGILLCRYHHMFIHQGGWQIIRDAGTYWLKPPTTIDPQQVLIEMPSKNPLMAAAKHAFAATSTEK